MLLRIRCPEPEPQTLDRCALALALPQRHMPGLPPLDQEPSLCGQSWGWLRVMIGLGLVAEVHGGSAQPYLQPGCRFSFYTGQSSGSF